MSLGTHNPDEDPRYAAEIGSMDDKKSRYVADRLGVLTAPCPSGIAGMDLLRIPVPIVS